MATEHIGFFSNPKRTKKDLEIAAQAKQFKADPQITIFLQSLAIVCLIVIVFILVKRLPIA
jgi:hypothetical protein